MEERRRIRIVVAVPGLDCHDRGAIFLAHGLKEAGMEVIYLGLFNTPESIVKTAVEEDADAIALSYLNDHLYMVFFPRVVQLLREKGSHDVCVLGGGRISEEDKPRLLKEGVTGLFGQGSTTAEIVAHIVARVRKERWQVR